MIIVEINSDSESNDVQFNTKYKSVDDWFKGEHDDETYVDNPADDQESWVRYENVNGVSYEKNCDGDRSVVREFKMEEIPTPDKTQSPIPPYVGEFVINEENISKVRDMVEVLCQCDGKTTTYKGAVVTTLLIRPHGEEQPFEVGEITKEDVKIGDVVVVNGQRQ